MRLLNSLAALAVFAPYIMADDAPVAPKLTLLYSMEALLGERFSLGPIPTGQERIVIPIVGGSFEGPRLNGALDLLPFGLPRRYVYSPCSGTVLSLGADWRLTDANGVLRPDARYNIRTKDGANIFVQTEGFPLPDGRTMLRGKFETASNGTYKWLNDVVGVGVLRRNGTSAVRIEMWHVSCFPSPSTMQQKTDHVI